MRTINFEPSPDQATALTAVRDWYVGGRSPALTLGGYAGTGKTVLTAQLPRLLPGVRIAYCAYTNRAAQVLRTKLQLHGVNPESVSTIHQLIYAVTEVVLCNGEKWVPTELCPESQRGATDLRRQRRHDMRAAADLIVVDEASMVDGDIWNDLLSYGVPVLAVGDHGQLPPIEGSFNLMANPMIRLERIHRQAADSPIHHVAWLAREYGRVPLGEYGPTVRKIRPGEPSTVGWTPELLVLCATNRDRIKQNLLIRAARGLDQPMPVRGDRVVALGNDHHERVFKGTLGTVPFGHGGWPTTDDYHLLWVDLDDDGRRHMTQAVAEQFNRAERVRNVPDAWLWDYGYALTVHRAQGTQFPRVLVFEDQLPGGPAQHARWLYTAVTRAERELTIVGY